MAIEMETYHIHIRYREEYWSMWIAMAVVVDCINELATDFFPRSSDAAFTLARAPSLLMRKYILSTFASDTNKMSHHTSKRSSS